jgi:hypothetical protein
MPDLKCGNCHYEVFVPQHVFEARGGSENIDCPGCRNLGMKVVIKEASGSVTEITGEAFAKFDAANQLMAEASSDENLPEDAAVTAVDPTDPSKGNRPVRRKNAKPR